MTFICHLKTDFIERFRKIFKYSVKQKSADKPEIDQSVGSWRVCQEKVKESPSVYFSTIRLCKMESSMRFQGRRRSTMKSEAVHGYLESEKFL